jgi:hypothetical protein
MKNDGVVRIAAILIGAAVLFVLELRYDAKPYVAIPAGIAAYIVTRVSFGLLFGRGSGAK